MDSLKIKQRTRGALLRESLEWQFVQIVKEYWTLWH